MGNLIKTVRVALIAGAVLLGGCGWVDDTGRQNNSSPDISLDDVNQLAENSVIEWPIRDFDDDGDISSLNFRLEDSGESVSGCNTIFSSTTVASSLRASCQPLLSDEDCEVKFDVQNKVVLVSLPELQRPAALRYEVEVVDEDGAVDSRSIDLCIASISEVPTAVNDDYAVNYLGDLEHSGSQFDDQCVSQGGTGVLENDSDDFDYSEGWDSGQTCLRAELVEGPSYAESFELRADGGFRYKSSGAAGPGATDSFEYSISDGRNQSEVATTTIAITGDNAAPLALNPSLRTVEDKALSVSVSQLASDPENTDLRIDSFSQPANGTVELLDGALRFTPDSNYFGEAGFEVVVKDASGLSVQSSVRVAISEVNDSPVVTGLPGSFVLEVTDISQVGEFHWAFMVADEETPAAQLQIILSSDTSVISSRIVGPSASGAVDLYLRPLNDGSTTAEVRVVDQPVGALDAQSQEYVVPLIVTGMNRPPLAVDDARDLFKNDEITVAVLDNDSDPDGEKSGLRIASIVDQPSNGTVSIVANKRQLRYVPDTGFSGADSLRYAVIDERGASAQALLDLTVINRAPVVKNELRSVLNSDFSVVNVLSNDVDPDGDDLSVVLLPGGYLGTTRLVGDAIRYSPPRGFTGREVIPYEVRDGDGGAAKGRLAIDVREISGDR